MEQEQEQSEAQSQSFCHKGEAGVNTSNTRRPSTGLRSHLLLPQILHPADKCQVEADPEAVLEEERRSAAVQLPFGDDGDAVAQEVGLIHVMSGENHCPACTTAQYMTSSFNSSSRRYCRCVCAAEFFRFVFVSRGSRDASRRLFSLLLHREFKTGLTHQLCISAAGPKWTSWSRGPLPRWARPK